MFFTLFCPLFTEVGVLISRECLLQSDHLHVITPYFNARFCDVSRANHHVLVGGCRQPPVAARVRCHRTTPLVD